MTASTSDGKDERIQKFTSRFLYEKCERLMRRKGYRVKSVTDYGGVIEVTWYKPN